MIMLSCIPKCWNTLRQLHGCWMATHRFRDYKPQPVTVESARRWLWQFDEKDRPAVLSLLDRVIYLSEKETEKQLVEHNEELLARLRSSYIPPKRIIYMQIHEAGSSSPVMLNMLRDRARLEQKGFHFVDSKPRFNTWRSPIALAGAEDPFWGLRGLFKDLMRRS